MSIVDSGGGVLTQTDESAQTITLIEPITGGIRVTIVGHGLANGNFGPIAGTTSYNDVWFISNITTDTFDIINQAFQELEEEVALAFVADEAGTFARSDGDQSDLDGLTGVTTVTSDPDAGPAQATIYILDSSTRLVVDGHMLQDPEVNRVMSEKAVDTGTQQGYRVGTGKVYWGYRAYSDGKFHYSSLVNVESTVSSPQQYDRYSLSVASGAFLYVNGGIYRAGSAWRIEHGGDLQWNQGTFYASDIMDNGSSPQIRVDATDQTNADKVRFNNITLDGSYPAAMFTRYGFGKLILKLKNGFYQTFGSSSQTITLLDLDNGENFAAQDIQESSGNEGSTGKVVVQNCSILPTSLPQTGTTNKYGYTVAYRQLDVPVVDINGDPLSEYSYYGKDINNGNRGVGPNGNDDTADVIYSGINQTGNLSENMLLQTQRLFSGDTAYEVDSRMDGDTIPIGVCVYGQAILTYAPSLVGLFSLTVQAQTVPDLLTTEQDRAVTDALLVISTAEEGYDAMQSEQCDNYAGETAKYMGRNGPNAVITDKTLVLNKTAAQVRDITGSIITWKVDEYTGGVEVTTGETVMENGALLNGGTFTGDIEIDNASDGDTYTDITAEKIVHTGTGTQALTLDGGATAEIEVTGGADLTVTLAGGSAVPTLTETNGTITLVEPPASTTYNNAALVDGTTILVRNTTTDTTIAYTASLATGTGYSIAMILDTDYANGDSIEIRISRKNVKVYYSEETDSIITDGSTSTINSATLPVLDAVSNTFDKDGADPSIDDKFTIDYIDNEIDLIISGPWETEEGMVWWKYQMTLQTPMEEFWNVNHVLDDGSFFNDSDVIPMVLDNTSSADAIESTNRRIHRRDGLRPIKSPISGTGCLDFSWREPVTVVPVGSAVLPQDIIDIVDGVWDEQTSGHTDAGSTGEALIDAAAGGGGGGATAQEVWEYSDRQLTAGTKDAEIDAIKSQTDQLDFVSGDVKATLDGETVARVTLVDTTTTNTDMKGTDGANTVAPDNAGIAANGVAIGNLNDLSEAQVKAQADAALADYNGPTKAEQDDAFDEIKGAGWTDETLKDIRDNLGTGGTTPTEIWNHADRQLTEGTRDAEIDQIASDVDELETKVEADARQAILVGNDADTQEELGKVKSAVLGDAFYDKGTGIIDVREFDDPNTVLEEYDVVVEEENIISKVRRP